MIFNYIMQLVFIIQYFFSSLLGENFMVYSLFSEIVTLFKVEYLVHDVKKLECSKRVRANK